MTTKATQPFAPFACATCFYFDAKTFEHTFRGIALGNKIEGCGHCRRRAPALVDSKGVGRFPIVIGEHDWCGEWQPDKRNGDEVRES